MPETDFTLGEIVGRLDGLMTRLGQLEKSTTDGFAKVHDRLDAGDRRFRAQDKANAADAAVKKVAMRVGALVIGGVVAVGGYVLSHIQLITELFIPPKGH